MNKELSIDIKNLTSYKDFYVIPFVDEKAESVTDFCTQADSEQRAVYAGYMTEVSYCYQTKSKKVIPAGSILITRVNRDLYQIFGVSYEQQILEGKDIPLAEISWRQETNSIYVFVNRFTSADSTIQARITADSKKEAKVKVDISA